MMGVMNSVRFECQPGCINCCTQDGYVYLTEEDLKRAAKFTGMTAAAFEAKYVYRTRNEMRFRKPRKKQCPFLEEHGCGIHPSKPTQCRTFPFWPELVERKAAWNRLARFCPGIGKGPLIQIGTAMEMAEEQRRAYPKMYQPKTSPPETRS
jgi:Fe-S-cluster containining protein